MQNQDFIPLIKMKVSAGLGKKLQRSGGLIINPSSQKGAGALRYFPQCVKFAEVRINLINQLGFQKHNTTRVNPESLMQTPFSFQRIEHVSNTAGEANAEGREEVLSEYLSGNDRGGGGGEDGEHGEDGERVRNRI